jgi:iron complex outermembrane receptor protein
MRGTFSRKQIAACLTRLSALVLLFGCEVVSAQALPAGQTAPSSPKDLTQVSIENLMNMEVTSVSKKEQKLSQVAAALFVITQEDIRRSGALNIPDLLRMVPGLDVAQINANTWAISARGFNFQFANKLLVLIDGRAVYTPQFAGVNWDTQDVPLEDIDRIEVICGPGGTVWGANAVNGVINVTTKKAAETPGVLVTGGGGTQALEFGTLQYGGKIKEDTSYRVFTKYLNENHFPDLPGGDTDDGWHLLHGGFRADTTLSKKDSLTIQGDLYGGNEGSTITHSILSPPQNVDQQKVTGLSGGDILGRWNHTFSSRSDTSLQIYFDRYTRSGPSFYELRNTIDFDFQHHLAWGTRNDLIWGAGFRVSADQTVGTIDSFFIPASRTGQLFSVFLQDQITLKSDRLYLYLGTKLENSYFTGYDFEPSARLAWSPNNRNTFWTAVSRATRTPSRRSAGLEAVLAAIPGPEEILLRGNSKIASEHMIGYELGYRAQASGRLSVGATAFINTYDGLESIEPQPSFVDVNSSPPVLVHPLLLSNKMNGTTYGIEAYSSWKVTRLWTISPGYSFLHIDLRLDPTSQDTLSTADTEGSNPGNQAQLRSHVVLPHGIGWDLNAYFVGRLPANAVPSYTRLDTQLSWRIAEKLEFNLMGQNLLTDHHAEFNDFLQSVNSSQVKRSGYAKLTWRF